MYSKDQTRELRQASTDLLKKTGQIGEADIDLLRNLLRFHEYRYYIMNDPLLADVEYDQLFKALQKLEAENPG
ncbi:MAG: DNA ligase (NAD(+)) LigA, partial [Chitinophagaceae bacterium]|nr:DNA ligase (NAD(+)) LigA [Chitinophagaceae bacterium]